MPTVSDNGIVNFKRFFLNFRILHVQRQTSGSSTITHSSEVLQSTAISDRPKVKASNKNNRKLAAAAAAAGAAAASAAAAAQQAQLLPMQQNQMVSIYNNLVSGEHNFTIIY